MENRNHISLATFIHVMMQFILIASFVSSLIKWEMVFIEGQYYVHASFFMTVVFGAWPIYGLVMSIICSRYLRQAYLEIKTKLKNK
jgi:hypothetical protein